jgi:hypothetical protein
LSEGEDDASGNDGDENDGNGELGHEINIDEYDEKDGEKCDDKDDNNAVYGLVPFADTVLEGNVSDLRFLVFCDSFVNFLLIDGGLDDGVAGDGLPVFFEEGFEALVIGLVKAYEAHAGWRSG